MPDFVEHVDERVLDGSRKVIEQGALAGLDVEIERQAGDQLCAFLGQYLEPFGAHREGRLVVGIVLLLTDVGRQRPSVRFGPGYESAIRWERLP